MNPPADSFIDALVAKGLDGSKTVCSYGLSDGERGSVVSYLWRFETLDALAVAKSLSPAQRALILESDPDDRRVGEGVGVELRSSARYATAKALHHRHLGLYSTGDEPPGMFWSNAAGLRVREELLHMESSQPRS